MKDPYATIQRIADFVLDVRSGGRTFGKVSAMKVDFPQTALASKEIDWVVTQSRMQCMRTNPFANCRFDAN